MAWLDLAPCNYYEQYLKELYDMCVAAVLNGVYDAKGRDITDLYRGNASVLKQLLEFKANVKSINQLQADKKGA